MIRVYEEAVVGAWYTKTSRGRLVTVVRRAGRAFSTRGASTTAGWTVGADIVQDILIAGAWCASAWCSSSYRILDAIGTSQTVCRIRSTASCT